MARGPYAGALREVAHARRKIRDVGGAVTGGGSGFDPTIPTSQQGGKPLGRSAAKQAAYFSGDYNYGRQRPAPLTGGRLAPRTRRAR